MAEIQQASNTTFRLFDWNRTGPDGEPRALHIEESLATTDYQRGPVASQTPQSTDNPVVRRLVSCDKFVLDRWQFEGERPLGDGHRFHIVAILEGEVTTNHPELPGPLGKGATFLVPAACGPVVLKALKQVTLLDMYLP